MARKTLLVGIPVLGLIIAGLFLIQNRSEEESGTVDRSPKNVERFDTVSDEPSRQVVTARWSFDRTLVYRFEVTGSLTVQPPAETGKDPIPAQFTLSGDLAIGPGTDDDVLFCQFRNIAVKGGSGSADEARRALEGRTSRLSISDRGEIRFITADDQAAVFLSHLEFVLPEGEEVEWRQDGRDPAGAFTSIYRLEALYEDKGRTMMKLEKQKEYTADPSPAKSLVLLPRYTSTGYFDVENNRMSLIEVSGAIPESEESAGITMKGRVHMTFLFDREETDPIVEVPQAKQNATSVKPQAKRSKPGRSRIKFSDISPNLHSPDTNLRCRAILQLTHVPGPEARRSILEAVEDSDFRIRASAAQAMVTYRSEKEVMGRLLRMLKSDSNPLVRYRVAGALKGSSSPEARELLSSVASGDSSKFVRKAANAALVYPMEGDIDVH